MLRVNARTLKGAPTPCPRKSPSEGLGVWVPPRASISARSEVRSATRAAHDVERIFAELGWRQGLKRFRRRGRLGSALEFSLHCIACNLKWALRASPSGLVFAIDSVLAGSFLLSTTDRD